METLLPPFQSLLQSSPHHTSPPALNLAPARLMIELTDHYLYASLMQENHYRVAHLEGAVRHLDEESQELKKQCNALRQEEIVEEIEVILLSADSISPES